MPWGSGTGAGGRSAGSAKIAGIKTFWAMGAGAAIVALKGEDAKAYDEKFDCAPAPEAAIRMITNKKAMYRIGLLPPTDNNPPALPSFNLNNEASGCL